MTRHTLRPTRAEVIMLVIWTAALIWLVLQ